MQTHHSGPTRFLHGALALAIGVQLITGLIMQAPTVRHSGNGFFTIHKDSDILIGALALAFWLVIATRRSGTEAGLLFPWLKADRRAAFFADTRRHLAAWRRGHLADFQTAAPMAAAVHGFGLVLVTAMAATGFGHLIASIDGASATPFGEWLRWLHGLTVRMVWLFVIGHGLTALLHHYADDLDLRSIWSSGAGEGDRAPREDP